MASDRIPLRLIQSSIDPRRFLHPSIQRSTTTRVSFSNPRFACHHCRQSSLTRVRPSSLYRRHYGTGAPTSRDRGPASTEDTQTDFAAMNILGNATPPNTGVDACTDDGFVLNNDMRVSGCGVLLVGGEVFKWRPWSPTAKGGSGGKRKLTDARGSWNVDREAWGVLDLIWPKPGTKLFGIRIA
jgi:NADH dehydrogenase [ubiquinone] 1 alpha subcomplex assembly factor 3